MTPDSEERARDDARVGVRAGTLQPPPRVLDGIALLVLLVTSCRTCDTAADLQDEVRRLREDV
jgi:hypothetical protein